MKKRYLFWVIVILGFLLGGQRVLEKPAVVQPEGSLAVSYIDVGQGDSTFILFPGGKTALIDAGEANYADRVISYLEKKGCQTIDYLICTHPHSDHIGGMKQVLETFSVGEVYMPKVSHTSRTYENLLQTIKRKGLSIKVAKAGVVIEPEAGVVITMAAPVLEEYEELNDYSAVIHLSYGDTSFLFTGDAEVLSEGDMLQSGQPLAADVLKVGHHGSSTSTSEEFLRTVSPRYAVISCGEGNSYGHPHREILQLLQEWNVKLYRTDYDGTVVAYSDGKNITFIETGA